MMDPSRLLATTREGLERELLRSALTEVAPDEVRARVLHSVNEVLATSAAVTAAGARSTAAGARSTAAGARSTAAASGTAGAGAGALSRTAPKLFSGLVSLQALCLAALVVVGVSVGVALYPSAERGSQSREGAAREGKLPGSQGNAAEAHAERNSPPEARSARATPGALANTELAPQHSSSSELEQGTSTPAQADGTAYSLDRSEASDGADGEELPGDWLGEQLQLLREARRDLQSGKLEQAAQLLDGYEQRFPGGVLGPQVVRLRAELRQQRLDRSAVP